MENVIFAKLMDTKRRTAARKKPRKIRGVRQESAIPVIDCRVKTQANGEKIIRKQEDKDKKKKDQKKGRVRTQNEVTDEESDGDNKDFLDEKEESEDEGQPKTPQEDM